MPGGSIEGFEALARLLHPEKCLIPPAAVIATAQKSAQIGAHFTNFAKEGTLAKDTQKRAQHRHDENL
jgi:EAL domain-containing protein (putative c-di-GMP-specific phosphodiesterase class I)